MILSQSCDDDGFRVSVTMKSYGQEGAGVC